MAAILIRTDGTLETLEGEVTLAVAQRAVGGYVEMLTVAGIQYLFDEDGLRKQLDPNIAASGEIGRIIVGNVLRLTGKDRWN